MVPFACLLLATMAHPPHSGACGHSLRSNVSHTPPVQTQAYHSRPVGPRRRLRRGDQEYDELIITNGSAAGFLPLAAAHARGILQPMRVVYDFELVEQEKDPEMCTSVGQANPLAAGGVCGEDDIVTPEKFAVLTKRLGWLGGFIGNMLSLKPVQDTIFVSKNALRAWQGVYGNVDQTNVSEADLFIYVTMKPDPSGVVAGYAQCFQMDQHKRCTVGGFNWTPSVIDMDSVDEVATISAQRHTALHETIHVLGGIKASNLIGLDGVRLADTETAMHEVEDAGYPGKKLIKLTTPQVLATARAQFNCPSLDGVPLEDQPLGADAHWEARVFGPEVMSYGTYSSETYLSDITLAFLNDTGHYYSNISSGGRLVPASADAIAQSTMGSLLGGAGKFDAVVPEKRTPGYIRWGRGEGCGFVHGKADTWSERYVCSKNKEYGCTPDNRIAGRCVLQLVGLPGGKLAAPISTERLPSTPGETGLPPSLQYDKILPDAKGAAPTLAGWSDSMDFIPVRVGTINCLDRMPKKLPSDKSTASGGSSLNLKSQMSGQLAAGADVGGQYRCKSCRCIKSSLQSAASFNPSFPKYGLCYMTNCCA